MTRCRVCALMSVCRRVCHGMVQGWGAVRMRCAAVRSDACM